MPADVRKAGPMYDLPIAVAILVASGQVPAHFSGMSLLGELALDGQVRHVNGVLPLVAMFAERWPEPAATPGNEAGEPDPGLDLAVVQGQEHVKRALEVASAGGHNVMLQGPPGSGKTLLARAMPGLLPPLTRREALEVTKLYSVAGLLGRDHPLLEARPFRSPHHTISHGGLVGGGSQIRPGEVSLAHRGVLFLDEFPEFGATALEALREPLETGQVTISRVRGSVTFPARFLLIAAMNP